MLSKAPGADHAEGAPTRLRSAKASDMAEALDGSDDEVDHVTVWPDTGREPGSAYDRSHFRIVDGNRIRGYVNTKHKRASPTAVACNGKRLRASALPRSADLVV